MQFRYLLLLVTIVSVVSAQDISMARKKKYSFFPGFYKGGLIAYITFIAIKAKILITLAVAVTLFTIGMKAFAAIKYFKDILSSCHHDHEGIVYSHPPPDIAYGNDFPLGGGHVEYSSYPGPSSGPTSYGGSYGPPKTPHSDSFYEKYGRSGGDDLENEMSNVMKRLMKRIDVTDYAFDSMHMDADACRRRFVCQIDQYAKRNSLLGFGLMFFSDQGLNKYRNDTIEVQNARQCADIYAECPS